MFEEFYRDCPGILSVDNSVERMTRVLYVVQLARDGDTYHLERFARILFEHVEGYTGESETINLLIGLKGERYGNHFLTYDRMRNSFGVGLGAAIGRDAELTNDEGDEKE